jgi:hypothetical protein
MGNKIPDVSSAHRRSTPALKNRDLAFNRSGENSGKKSLARTKVKDETEISLAAALLAQEKKKWESKLRPGEQKEPQIGENVTRRRKQENKPVRWHHKSSGDREQETEASRKMNKGCGLLRAREKSRATAVRVTKSKRRKKL